MECTGQTVRTCCALSVGGETKVGAILDIILFNGNYEVRFAGYYYRGGELKFKKYPRCTGHIIKFRSDIVWRSILECYHQFGTGTVYTDIFFTE